MPWELPKGLVQEYYSSTSEIYDDPTESPQKEEYWGHVNPIGIGLVTMKENE